MEIFLQFLDVLVNHSMREKKSTELFVCVIQNEYALFIAIVVIN